MSGALSQYAESILASYITGANMPVAPSGLFLALSSANPTDNGSGISELVGGGYARQPYTLSPINTTNVSGTATSNNDGIAFTNLSGTASHFAIFDAGTNGNMIFFGPLDVTRVVTAGDSVSFASGVIKLTIGGFIGKTLGEAFMNWMGGVTPPNAPTNLRLGLSTTDPLIDGTGVSYPQITDGYSHKTVTFSAPSFIQGQGTTISSNIDVVFGPANTNSWGTITHATVIDGSDGIILQGVGSDPTLIAVGQGLGIVSGAISFRIS